MAAILLASILVVTLIIGLVSFVIIEAVAIGYSLLGLLVA